MPDVGDELSNWRSQFVTSNSDLMGLRYAPYCFTEQGVTMLACILNSDIAIEMNIRIIRVFTGMREMLMTHKDILLQLKVLEEEVSHNSAEIQLLFEALKQLLSRPEKPMKPIGFTAL
jgi:hypothetical protein